MKLNLIEKFDILEALEGSFIFLEAIKKIFVHLCNNFTIRSQAIMPLDLNYVRAIFSLDLQATEKLAYR